MANRIVRVQKFHKQNIKQHVMTNNILTTPVSIPKFHNANDKNNDMTLN